MGVSVSRQVDAQLAAGCFSSHNFEKLSIGYMEKKQQNADKLRLFGALLIMPTMLSNQLWMGGHIML